MNTDIRCLLAGFYYTMESVVQHANYMANYTLSTSPLPLLDANEICITAGARDFGKITFRDNHFLSGAREGRQPWRTCHLSNDISVDMGEWTRYEAFQSNLPYGQGWHLPD